MHRYSVIATDMFCASACDRLRGGYMLVIFGPTSRSKFTVQTNTNHQHPETTTEHITITHQ